MKIKQYRNLFENWQRHLVEDEVSNSLLQVTKQIAPKDVKVISISTDEEEKISDETGIDRAAAEELKAVGDSIVMASPENAQRVELDFDEHSLEKAPEALREQIYRIVADLLLEADRGGIGAQEATAKWLISQGHHALSNISGSTIPDVIVIDPDHENIDSLKKEYPTTRKVDRNVYKELVAKKAIKARFEVKSATPKSGDVLETAFFDQTISKGDKGEKYYGPILRRMADRLVKKGKLTFVNTENPEEKVELENLEDGALVSAMLTQAHYDEKKCGEFGQLDAPEVNSLDADGRPQSPTNYYPMWRDWGGTKMGDVGNWAKSEGLTKVWENVWVSARPFILEWPDGSLAPYVVFASKKEPTPGGEVSPQRGRSQVKIYFYKQLVQGEFKGEWRYGFISADEIDLEDYNVYKGEGWRYFVAVGGRERAATTSGKFAKECFVISSEEDEISSDEEGNKGTTIRQDAIEKISEHWKTGGDNYFVVAKREGTEENPIYNDLYVYTTKPNENPLELEEVPSFNSVSGDMQDLGFSSYGTPSKNQQARVKIYSNMKHPEDAKKKVP